LSPQKQSRVCKLANLYTSSYDAAEKEEIRGALAEMLFPNAGDLKAEPLDDQADSRIAKRKLKEHRKYVANQIALHRAEKNWTQEH
jgi:hypothetical protein